MLDRIKQKFHRHRHEKNVGNVPLTCRPPSAAGCSLQLVRSNLTREITPYTKQVAPEPSQEAAFTPSEPSAKDAPTEAHKQKEFPPRDLWLDAFNQLPPLKQDTLRRMGFNTLSSGQMESSINGLVSVVNKKQENCEKKFWRVSLGGEDNVLRNYTTQILGWLEKAGDIALQFAPPQASLPWGLIKNIMQIPVNESEQMGAMLAPSERIVRITSRGQVYEQVYLPQTYDVPLDSVQKGLESGLLQIYSQSLDLLAESLRLFSSGTANRTLEAIVNPGQYSGSLSGLGEQEDELLWDVQACETKRSAAAADSRMIGMLETLNAPMARMNAGIGHLLQHMEESDRIKMLEWSSPIPFGMHHDDIKERRTPNTGDWLVQHEDFHSWEEKTSSALFWLQGSPGTGKTYLSSNVVDRIRGRVTDPPKDEEFAFFYCNRNEEERTKPLAILQSIVRQLSTAASSPESIRVKLAEACKNARVRGSNFRADECKKQILASLDTYQQTTLVIDAMDECNPESRDELIEALKSFVSDSRQPVKIFISSRPDPDIKLLLEDTPNIAISANDNQEDIEKFLTLELEKLSKKAVFLKRIKADAIAKLLQRCQGMFQWASLQVHGIVKCGTESRIWKRLDNLPKDLQKAYDEIWDEIESFEEPDQSVAKRALCWVIAATKPMSSEMILSAVPNRLY